MIESNFSTVRILKESDKDQVLILDKESGNNIEEFLESEMAYGIFLPDDSLDYTLLAGYLSAGYADCLSSEELSHTSLDEDSRLISEVFIRKEYRGKGLGEKLMEGLMEKEEIKNNSLFLAIMDDELENFYSKFGFKMCSEYYMVKS